MLSLDVFEGPLDLLLQLINRRQLDITEVALSQVTDEFIAHVRAGEQFWDLDQTSGFLVIAATLLEIKAARLLPGAEAEQPEDPDVLEARDLLFARLMQYRAFKQAAAMLGEGLERGALMHARPGGLEPQFRDLLPEVSIPGGPARIHDVALRVLSRAEPIEVPVSQLHVPQVSVAEQTRWIAEVLAVRQELSFSELVSTDRLTTVARFLSLLDLYRSGHVEFEQASPLGELVIRWNPAGGPLVVSDEFDETREVPADE